MDESVRQLLVAAAQAQGLPPEMALRMAQVESGGNQNARSPAGAIGVTQLMPGTAAGMGVDPYDLQQNVRGGVGYLAKMYNRYGGDRAKAFAAYNAGPGRVPVEGPLDVSRLPSETQDYVRKTAMAEGPVHQWLDPTTTGSLPQTPQQQEETYNNWNNFLASPDNRAALFQIGINLLQPVPLGQSTLGHIAGALGAGAETYSNRQQMRQSMAAEDWLREMARVREEREQRESTSNIDYKKGLTKYYESGGGRAGTSTRRYSNPQTERAFEYKVNLDAEKAWNDAVFNGQVEDTPENKEKFITEWKQQNVPPMPGTAAGDVVAAPARAAPTVAPGQTGVAPGQTGVTLPPQAQTAQLQKTPEAKQADVQQSADWKASKEAFDQAVAGGRTDIATRLQAAWDKKLQGMGIAPIPFGTTPGPTAQGRPNPPLIPAEGLQPVPAPAPLVPTGPQQRLMSIDPYQRPMGF